MKNSFIIISILTLLWISPVNAAALSDFINNEAPSAYFYSQEFDKLVLDITIPSGIIGGEDKLSALTIKNNGTARERDDITKFKLWKDAGEPGFQGMGKDEELGTFIYYSPNISWYLSGLNTAVPASGLRIFVSAEIAKSPTASRFIKMQIPSLYDENGNKVFDLGDTGVFMESKNNGPEGIMGLVNSFSQTIRTFLIDNLDPVSVITDPKDNSVITSETYTIKGQGRDQGGSTPAWVKISINPSVNSGQVIWYDVNSTGSNYSTWEYQWQDIKEGNYTIKTQSADWIGNTETTGDSIDVTVKFPGEPEPESESELEPEPEPEPEPLTEIEQLQEKIKQVQQQIIELLNQLIQIYLEQLSSL